MLVIKFINYLVLSETMGRESEREKGSRESFKLLRHIDQLKSKKNFKAYGLVTTLTTPYFIAHFARKQIIMKQKKAHTNTTHALVYEIRSI